MITQLFILFFFYFGYFMALCTGGVYHIHTCLNRYMYKVLKPTSICDDFIGDKLDCSNKFLQPSITGIDSHVVIAPLRQWWVRGEKHLWWWGSSEPVGNFSHANRSGFTVFRSNVCLISSHSKGRLNLAGRVGGSIKIKL